MNQACLLWKRNTCRITCVSGMFCANDIKHMRRLPYIPGMSLLKILREICTSSTFLTWFFGLGSFFQDQKFRTVWPSSVIWWKHSTWKSRTICFFHVRRMLDLYYSCTICYVLHAQLYTIHVLFVHNLCMICKSLVLLVCTMFFLVRVWTPYFTA